MLSLLLSAGQNIKRGYQMIYSTQYTHSVLSRLRVTSKVLGTVCQICIRQICIHSVMNFAMICFGVFSKIQQTAHQQRHLGGAHWMLFGSLPRSRNTQHPLITNTTAEHDKKMRSEKSGEK